MLPHNEPGDRAFRCIDGKCLNPDVILGSRKGVGKHLSRPIPTPSVSLIRQRDSFHRLIWVLLVIDIRFLVFASNR
jgi:hypothetical protein